RFAMLLIDEKLIAWKKTLCRQVDVSGLFSRSRVAHKWKAPFRSLSLREAVAWRTQDLLEQSVALYDVDHLLGARILLRSAFETVAVLIYLNQLTRQVLDGSLDFHSFSEKTSILLLGSRDDSTPLKSLNIITILNKCVTRYPELMELYENLSESAHPNYEGIAVGYSDIDIEKYIVNYKNKCKAIYGNSHLQMVECCISVFYDEYNGEWNDAFEKLEKWIEKHDKELKAKKGDA
ncbi:hypothetical protein ACFL6K_03955, partial [Candidatus Latescibacterota bacterium]